MRIKKGFLLRKVGRDQVVVTVGPAREDLNGLIRLNETGAFLWRKLEFGANEEELVQALTGEYEVSAEQAAADVARFLQPLREVGCIEEHA